jgi:hypothetical protein
LSVAGFQPFEPCWITEVLALGYKRGDSFVAAIRDRGIEGMRFSKGWNGTKPMWHLR